MLQFQKTYMLELDLQKVLSLEQTDVCHIDRTDINTRGGREHELKMRGMVFLHHPTLSFFDKSVKDAAAGIHHVVKHNAYFLGLGRIWPLMVRSNILKVVNPAKYILRWKTREMLGMDFGVNIAGLIYGTEEDSERSAYSGFMELEL